MKILLLILGFFLYFVFSTSSSFPTQIKIGTTFGTNGIVQDAILSYKLENPSVDWIIEISSTADNKRKVFNGELDVIVDVSSLTYTDVQENPDLLTIPVAALAAIPGYNVEGLSSTSTPLIFARDVIARIMACNITTWNHPDIVKTNPDKILPNANITIILQNDNARIDPWSWGLKKLWPEWENVIGVGTKQKWPKSCNIIIGLGTYGITDGIKAYKNSIGFVPLPTANARKIRSASILSEDSVPVQPNDKTISFAMLEMSNKWTYTQFTDMYEDFFFFSFYLFFFSFFFFF